MAIYSSVPPPGQTAAATQAQLSAADIEAWTVHALQSLNVSDAVSGPGVTLSIPLDVSATKDKEDISPKATLKTRRESLQRDSLRRRDALLKGKEGSRRRQRWENDRLLHVPGVQPPLPSDWEVRPTYPVHSVPYYLAPLWDAGVRHRAEETAAAAAKKKRTRKSSKGGSSADENDKTGQVPQELRQKLKKAKGAKSLLQDLEEEVRRFVQEWEMQQSKLGAEGAELDSDDEEIVFVGKNCTMSDEQRKTVEEQLEREKLVFDSLADDHGASFGRWLVHSIATYYGLTSRSITVGNPARREAYVGIKQMKTGRRSSGTPMELPRPLWGMI